MTVELIERQHLEKEISGLDVFNLENLVGALDIEIVEHTETYLGEFRFEVPRQSYKYIVEKGKIKGYGVPMDEVAQRAINRRNLLGKSASREIAEKQGFLNLEEQLKTAVHGDTIVWVGPPGPEEDGYGDYGFIYIGSINGDVLSLSQINMVAIRVEKPSIEDFNKVMSMFTGDNIECTTAEEFLMSPRVVKKNFQEEDIDRIINSHFITPPSENLEVFNVVIRRLRPLMADYVSVLKNGTREEKSRVFNSLENYALKLKKDYKREKTVSNIVNKLEDVVHEYGWYKPPPLSGGSCPPGARESNSIFSMGSSLERSLLFDKYGARTFKCPSCGKENIRPYNKLIEKCQHCGSDKVACKDTSSFKLAA